MHSNKSEILEAISGLTVIELSELINDMEKKFGVSAAAIPVATVNNAKKEDNISQEKTKFEVFLKEVGSNRIGVIKIIREITKLGLKDSKDLVDKSPKKIKENVSKKDAEIFKKKLEEVGAKVIVK